MDIMALKSQNRIFVMQNKERLKYDYLTDYLPKKLLYY